MLNCGSFALVVNHLNFKDSSCYSCVSSGERRYCFPSKVLNNLIGASLEINSNNWLGHIRSRRQQSTHQSCLKRVEDKQHPSLPTSYLFSFKYCRFMHILFQQTLDVTYLPNKTKRKKVKKNHQRFTTKLGLKNLVKLKKIEKKTPRLHHFWWFFFFL